MIENRQEKLARAVIILIMIIAACMYVRNISHTIETAAAEEPAIVNEYEGIIRFHVIANSDSEEDQALKLQVRNNVVLKLQNALMASTDIDETRTYIEENMDLIQSWAEDVVHGWGYDYDVKVRLGISAIPARQYDELYFPAGNYEALTITIGEGKGQNWWCVVFPPLCLVDATDEAYGELFAEDEQGQIVLRSKLAEILRENKGKKADKKARS